MIYRKLGRNGIRVSPICLGTMMFGGQTTEADSIRIVHKAVDQGINFVDTANMYNAGQSEIVVGKAIADRRDQVVLATKGRQSVGSGPNDSGAGRLHLMRELDRSLTRMQVDVIDLYYLHAPDTDTPIEETLRTLDDMVRSGKSATSPAPTSVRGNFAKPCGPATNTIFQSLYACSLSIISSIVILKWSCCRCAGNTVSAWSAIAHWHEES